MENKTILTVQCYKCGDIIAIQSLTNMGVQNRPDLCNHVGRGFKSSWWCNGCIELKNKAEDKSGDSPQKGLNNAKK